MTAPWLTAGVRVSGLVLASVEHSTTADDKTIEGLTLVTAPGEIRIPSRVRACSRSRSSRTG